MRVNSLLALKSHSDKRIKSFTHRLQIKLIWLIRSLYVQVYNLHKQKKIFLQMDIHMKGKKMQFFKELIAFFQFF